MSVTRGSTTSQLLSSSLTDEILGAAIEVHKALGPGLLESAYESCLAHELTARSIPFQRQIELPVKYKESVVDAGYRIDMLVNHEVVIELKAIEQVMPIHEAQLMTYLKLSGHRVGLLINFNVPLLKNGIVRRVL